jgi:hypothetical protein
MRGFAAAVRQCRHPMNLLGRAKISCRALAPVASDGHTTTAPQWRSADRSTDLPRTVDNDVEIYTHLPQGVWVSGIHALVGGRYSFLPMS